MVEGFCFRCNKKVAISSPTEFNMKNYRKAVHGNCPVCNAKVYTSARNAPAIRDTDRTKK